MQIVFETKKIPTNLSEKNRKIFEISPKVQIILNRISLYSFCISVFIWLFLVSPEVIFDINFSEHIFGIIFFFIMIILILFIHEIVHLLACPSLIFRKDTYFLINYKVPLIEMNLAIVPGGSITRECFIWLSLMPLLVLTILPFILMALSLLPLPAIYGVFACINLAVSSRDVFNVYRVWKGMDFGQALADEQIYGVNT